MNTDGDPEKAKGKHARQQHARSEASARKEPEVTEQGDTAERDTLILLLKQFNELQEYFAYYVTVKADQVKVSLRNLSLWILVAALGFLVVGGLIVSANWFVLSGTAEGLGALFGDRLWVGKIIAGLLMLAALGLCTWGAMTLSKRAARERTEQKYEDRQDTQQAEYGRDVREQSAAASQRN